MGKMRDTGGDFVAAVEYTREVDGALSVSHVAYEEKDKKHAFCAYRGSPSKQKRRWVGDVFFDHVRGVIHEHPEPVASGAPHPFLLVCYSEYFDWNATGSASVKEYDSAAELIETAKKYVADERAAGTGVSELWEVYGVRVLEYHSSWFGF